MSDFFVPQYVADFKCVMCGKCCGGWYIHFTKSEYDSVKANLSQIDADLKMEDVLQKYDKDHRSSEHYSFLKFKDQLCPFLKDNRCQIFSNFGKDKGAFVCQTFPIYNFLTPYGEFYNTSFYCTSTSAMLFKKDFNSLVLKNPAVFKQFSKVMHDYSKKKNITLSYNRSISWDAYYLWEEFVRKIKKMNRLLLVDKILILANFLNLLGALDAEIDTKIFFSVEKVFEENFENNLKAIHNLQPDVVYQLQNIKFLVDKKTNMYPNSPFKKYIQLMNNLFLDGIDSLGEKYQNAYNQYKADFQEYEYVLENYFFAKLTYNSILFERGVSSGFKDITFMYCLVVFLTTCLAEQGKKFPEALSEAICTVEKKFGHDLKMFDFWDRCTKKEPHVLLTEISSLLKI